MNAGKRKYSGVLYLDRLSLANRKKWISVKYLKFEESPICENFWIRIK